MDHPERAEIWLVSLDPTVGRELGKTRPALIISNNKNNEYASTITLIPITTSLKNIYPFEIMIPGGQYGLDRDSKIKCNQVRTVDKKRLVKKIGKASSEYICRIEKALLIHLDIDINNMD